MVYEWKSGSRHKVSAQVAGEVCSRLESEGRLNAVELVDESRPEDSPMHKEFEWDDSIAGEEWRRHQARNIINTIIVVPEVEERPVQRAFFKVESQSRNYESINVIIQQEDKYRKLLAQAKREFESYKDKYMTLKELKKLFETGNDTFKDVA